MKDTISIVIPCRNEAGYIERAVMDALAQQHAGADLEVLVAVGPSADDTHAIVERLAREHAQVTLVENPAGVVPHGLNAAIRAARGSYIVRMDAHSRYPPDYALTLTMALDRLNADNVGGVWETLPPNDGDKAWSIAQVLSSPLGVGNAMFRLGVGAEREVDTVPYGTFRRELFDRIGYFDEDLIRNQDDEHNGRIRRSGGRIYLLPQVRIQYFSRDRISKLWRMYREYGLFKPLVNLKLGSPATLRQFAPPVFVSTLLVLPLLALRWPWMGLLWCLQIALYALVLLAVSVQLARKGGRPGAVGWLALAFITVHVAYGLGYLEGIVRFTLLRQRMRPDRVRTNR